MGLLTATLTELKDFGSQIARTARRFVACNFLDKVMITHPDAAAVMWDASSDSVDALPGLPVNEFYRGVSAFQGFLVLWVGERLKWSDQNDYTMWIPVKTTAGSFVFALIQPYTLGAVGVEGALIYVDKNPTGLTVGQFIRIDTDPTYTFFSVASVLPATGQIGLISGFVQTIPANTTQPLFLQSFIAYAVGQKLYVASTPTLLMLVTTAAKNTGAVGLILAADFVRPAIGGTVIVSVTSTPQVDPGTYISVGASLSPGQDIYLVNSIDKTANTLTLVRQGVGSSAAGTHFAGEFLVDQQYVTVQNLSSVTAIVSYFNAPLNEVFGFTLTPLDLTGADPLGTVYPVGKQIFTVDANGAGEAVNTGSDINGRILHFGTLGDYGYLFKHRSIQSVQFVGIDQGTFFIRPAVTDEGLVGDYSFVKVGNDQMFIWGNKGIYKFSGFDQLVPVAQQHFKQLKKELDPGRANQIVGFHNENDYEIWFIYPRIDQYGVNSLRVFIYNYLENSATIDDYATTFGSLTAAGRIEVNQDLTWQNTLGTWVAPVSFTSSADWASQASDTNPSLAIIGTEKNAPPLMPTMTLQAARDLYYGAHPGGPLPVYTDSFQFLARLNDYWQTHGGWPALSVVDAFSIADGKILRAFGYVASSGIPAYFLGLSPSTTPGLLTYDNGVTSRNNDPVRCVYESVDYDGDDPLAFKYTDTQWFSIQVKSKISIDMPLLVYIGSKANYDDAITWSDPIVLKVQGNATGIRSYVSKTNVKASGRYFRIRLQAATPGLVFRVSQIRILGRVGGTS